MTFTLPDGTRVRTSSNRRYILVAPSIVARRPTSNGVVGRTDNLDTARRRAGLERRSYGSILIFDSTTGRLV